MNEDTQLKRRSGREEDEESKSRYTIKRKRREGEEKREICTLRRRRDNEEKGEDE